MPFVEVRLSEVQLEKPSPVPAGQYVFQLLPGAEYKTNQYSGEEELNVKAAIAEGEHAGRVVFWRYKDPQAISKRTQKPNTYVLQALKKLEISLGADSLPGEDPATYLNRVSQNGHSRFTGTMGGTFIPNGATEPKVEFQIFGVTAAA